MRSILFIAIVTFSVLGSCQKKTDNITKNYAKKDLKDFLKISLSKNENAFIGKLNTINNSLTEDFNIEETQDSIFVYKNFLESDNFDGKEIFIEKNNSIKKIDLKYKIAIFFNGTEKENKFIPLNLNIPVTINNGSSIPLFSSLKNNQELQSFISKNSLKIKEKAYKAYLNYYNNIPPEELKKCCPTDFENFNKIKKINDISSLNIEKDLAMYIDYESIIVNIIGSQKYKPIIFTKKIEESNSGSYEKQSIKTSNLNTNWKGTYNISTKIISQFDNKETVGLYTITIESDQKAILSIKADHVEDYWCEGDYRLIKEDNILHAKGKCDEDDMDDLYIKNENGKFYIKSKRFVNQDWQELKSN